MGDRPSQALDAQQYETEAGEARAAVVARIDASHEFFTEAAPARAILYQVPYVLNEKQFAALRLAAADVGDVDGFYLHAVERPVRTGVIERVDWWIRFGDFDAYLYAVGLENVIHSPSGRWVIYAMESWCAVVAGSYRFVDSLIGRWPSWSESDGEIFGPARQVEAFLAMLAHVGYVDAVMQWLPALLRHVYGPREGQRLLSRYRSLAESEASKE